MSRSGEGSGEALSIEGLGSIIWTGAVNNRGLIAKELSFFVVVLEFLSVFAFTLVVVVVTEVEEGCTGLLTVALPANKGCMGGEGLSATAVGEEEVLMGVSEGTY